MTAPIVYELRKGVVPERELVTLARSLRDADLTTRSLGLIAGEGQLWERLAERA